MKSNTDFWVEEMMKKNGWYCHFSKDNSFPYGANIHTHGIPSLYGHLDLQICYTIDPDLAYVLLYHIVENIKSGKKFTPGIKYPDIAGECVEFAEAKEDGRIVLRIILPDKYGNVRGEIKDQWKGCRVYPTNN